MQENWIGRSDGARVRFPLKGRDDRLEVYTTRPDTLFGASFCAISPDHPLAAELAAGNPDLADFIAECRRTGTSEAAIETAEKKGRSEEHTSELQSLMRISYAVFCLKKQKQTTTPK